MGMIRNDIDDVVSALIHSEGRPAHKVAKRLIERGLKLLFDEDEIGIHDVIVPSELDGRYKVRTHLALADDTTTINAAKLGAMEGTLRLAGETFHEYAQHHMDKDMPDTEKAGRNVRMARACYDALGDDSYTGLLRLHGGPEDDAVTTPAAARSSMGDWEASVRAAQAADEAPTGFEGEKALATPAEAAENGSLTPVGDDSASPAPDGPAGSAKGLMRRIFDAMEASKPIKGVEVHLDDRPTLDVLQELKLITRDDVSDILGVTTEARLQLGIKPRGAIDLPVEVAEITHNTPEAELLARYCEGKIAAIDKAIAKREAPVYSLTCSWEESYQHCAMTLRAMASEIRQGLHIPVIHGEARVIPYNEDRSTGISHRVALDTFFDDVHARNVMAGWWTDITTGQPKKRNVGELFILMVTELWEAYDAWRNNAPDDKLPEFPGLGVEIGDLLIRVADFAGALAAGRVIAYDPDSDNPGQAMFVEIGEIAERYESIRKTPAALGGPELADFIPATTVGKMIDGKLAFNATRADHKIENRLKEDGKRT
jgi:hypothetical protein